MKAQLLAAVWDGISPDWGPFSKVGNTAKTIIAALMAGIILWLFARAIAAAGTMQVGRQQMNSMQAEDGRAKLISSLVALAIVASMGTIFTIVFGLGI